MVALDFTDDYITRFTSDIYGAACTLVVETIEFRNWLIRFFVRQRS